jgi:hypothetical protein
MKFVISSYTLAFVICAALATAGLHHLFSGIGQALMIAIAGLAR